MILNLIANLKETTPIDSIRQFNQIVTFFLNKEFRKLGVKTNIVPVLSPYKRNPPMCDHSLLICGTAFVNFDVCRAKKRPHIFGTKEKRRIAKKYCNRIYNSTRDKTTVFLDSYFSFWDRYFDRVFTIVPPKWHHKHFEIKPSSKEFSKLFGKDSKKKWYLHPERYVWAGWGADPKYCYPDKNEQTTIYIDHYETNPKFVKRLQKWYNIYDKVFDKLENVKLYDKRIRPTSRSGYHPFPDLQKRFRESHFYIDPQLGSTGLTRLESSMCGCLLVTAKAMYTKWAMDQLETATWETEKELRKILATKTNPKRIHRKVRGKTWTKVAKRIIKSLSK